MDDEFYYARGETLQWVLRSQLENGPLALLQLRQFTLPAEIFTIATESDFQLPEDNMESNGQEGEE